MLPVIPLYLKLIIGSVYSNCIHGVIDRRPSYLSLSLVHRFVAFLTPLLNVLHKRSHYLRHHSNEHRRNLWNPPNISKRSFLSNRETFHYWQWRNTMLLAYWELDLRRTFQLLESFLFLVLCVISITFTLCPHDEATSITRTARYILKFGLHQAYE